MKPEEKSVGAPSLYRVKEFLLDPAWYRKSYPEAVLAVQAGSFKNLIDFHAQRGDQELKCPSPLFAAPYYAHRSGYFSRAPAWGLVEDYLRFGADRGISAHWLFSEEFFQSQSAALRSSVEARTLTGSYIYYLRVGCHKGMRPHPMFSPWLAQQQLPGLNPLALFTQVVDTEHLKGQSPSPLFDPQWYAGRYPDLPNAVGPGQRLESLLQHFCEFGLDEGRLPLPDLDVDHYLRECLKAQVLDNVKGFKPVTHFLYYGIKAGLNPNRFFQAAYYLEHNPQAAAEIAEFGLLGPFEHFLAIGLKRNYKAAPPLVSMAVDDDAAKSLYEKRARLAADRMVRTAPLVLQAPAKPRVSAVVPVYNNFNYTAWLLQQFHAYQAGNPQLALEVIVVDNGSTDLTRQLPELAKGLKLVRTDKPTGYPAACNAGAKVATGDYVVFLNNDIELIEGSFEAVAKALDDATVGAVGGRVIKLNGVLQEAGGLVWRDGSAAGYGRGQDPLAARFMVARDVDYCSGCFLGVNRELFESLGGFDEVFSPGYYEETDLCARIWAGGHRVRYEPEVAVYHYEYASFSKGRPETISTALMARNRGIYVERNPQFLEGQPAPDFSRIDSFAFRRGKAHRHAVLIEDFVPSEGIGSGFGRARDIVNELLAQGWWVTLWVLHKREGIEPLNSGLCETIFQADYADGLTGYLKAEGDTLDLVWVCRTHNFKRAGATLDAWRAESRSKARVVFDTEAVACVRTWLTGQLALSEKPSVEDIAAQLDPQAVATELAGAQYADTVVAVNDVDRHLIAGALKVDTRELGHRFVARPTPLPFAEREHLLFCGAIHEVGSPNYDSLVWFCNKVMPVLRKKLPGCRLKVVGYWKPGIALPEALSGEDIDVVGAVDDLDPWFEKARVFVAPTRVAAGIPHKVHQSMALGVPAVVTPILARQLREMSPLGQHPKAFFEAADFSAGAFAAAVIEAYSDAKAWQAVRDRATEAVQAHCNPGVFGAALRSILAAS